MRAFLFATLAILAIFAVAPAMAQPKQVAIVSFGEHPTVSEIIDGMKAAMTELGHNEGVEVTYSFDHVNWDRTQITTMLTKVAALQPDVIFTLTTPVVQTAARSIRDRSLPIVFTLVQDPVASGLLPAWDSASETMSGALIATDADGSLAQIRTLLPAAQRIGMPYNPGDDADNAVVALFQEAAARHGFELVTVGVDNTNAMAERLQTFAGRVDAIYVLASSLFQPATSHIAAITDRMGIPTFNAVSEPVLAHEMLASYSVDFAHIGANVGQIIDQVLRGRQISEIPPVAPRPEDYETTISGRQLARHGLSLPDSLKDCDCVLP